MEHELLVDILASVDITVSTVSSILMAQIPSQKESIMSTNINQLLSLTGFELAKLGDQFEAKYGYESDMRLRMKYLRDYLVLVKKN